VIHINLVTRLCRSLNYAGTGEVIRGTAPGMTLVPNCNTALTVSNFSRTCQADKRMGVIREPDEAQIYCGFIRGQSRK
jgi:hypothetical protein